MKSIKRYKLRIIKKLSHGDGEYSLANIARNIISLYGGRWQLHLAWYLRMYTTDDESLNWTSETNIILYINYIDIKKSKKFLILTTDVKYSKILFF